MKALKIFLASVGVFVSVSAVAERSGEELVAQYCAKCHGTPGLPVAPKTSDEWQAFISKKSVDEMVAVTKTGVKAMPRMGTCFDCTDAELKAAVEAILP